MSWNDSNVRNPYDSGRDYGRDNNWRDNNWRDNNWRKNNGCENNEHENNGRENNGRENNGRDRNWEMRRWDHGDNAASTVYARQPERRGGKEADTDDVVVVDSDVIDAADKKDDVDIVDNSRVAGNEKETTEDDHLRVKLSYLTVFLNILFHIFCKTYGEMKFYTQCILQITYFVLNYCF